MYKIDRRGGGSKIVLWDGPQVLNLFLRTSTVLPTNYETGRRPETRLG